MRTIANAGKARRGGGEVRVLAALCAAGAVALALPATAAEPVPGADETFARWVAPLGAVASAFDGAFASDGTLTVSGVSVRWELPGAVFGRPGEPVAITVAVPELTIEGLAPDGDGHAAERVAMDEVRVTAGDGEVVLTDLVVEGPSWPAVPAPAAAPAGPLAAIEPALRWIAELDAAAITVRSPAGRIEAGEVADGRIGSFTLAPAADIAGAGQLEVTGIHIGALVAALYDSAEDAARRTFIERAVLSGVVDENADGETVRIDGVTVSDVALGTAAPSIAAGIDSLIALDAAGAAIARDGRAAAIGRIADVVAVGEFAMEGFTVAGDGADRNGFTRLAARDLAAGGTAELVMEGIFAEDADPTSGLQRTMSLDRLAVLDIGLPTSGAVVRATGEDPLLADILAAVPRIGRVEMEGLAIDDGSASISSDGIAVDLGGHIGPIPTRLASTAHYRIGLPDGMPPELAETLEARGIEAIEVRETMAAEWDGTREALSVDWNGVAEGLASYRFAFNLAGVDRVVFEAPDRAAETLATLALASALVEVADRGVSEIGLAVVERAGASREEAVETVADFLETAVAPYVPLPLGSGPFAIAERLLAGEARVTVSARPERPIPIMQITAAATLAPLQLTAILGLSLDVAP